MITSLSNTTITTTWNRPGAADGYVYSIARTDPPSLGFIEVANSITDAGDSISYMLTGLAPFTTYTLQVTATGGDLRDPNTCELTGKTLEGGTLFCCYNKTECH